MIEQETIPNDEPESTTPPTGRRINKSFVKDVERAPLTAEQNTAMNRWRIDILIIIRQWEAITGSHHSSED